MHRHPLSHHKGLTQVLVNERQSTAMDCVSFPSIRSHSYSHRRLSGRFDHFYVHFSSAARGHSPERLLIVYLVWVRAHELNIYIYIRSIYIAIFFVLLLTRNSEFTKTPRESFLAAYDYCLAHPAPSQSRTSISRDVVAGEEL